MMLLSVLLIWLGQLLLLEPVHTYITDNSANKASIRIHKNRGRSYSEVHFIQMEFGIALNPRTLSKREKLALALTNKVSNDQ
jgi:hypothetical protein